MLCWDLEEFLVCFVGYHCGEEWSLWLGCGVCFMLTKIVTVQEPIESFLAFIYFIFLSLLYTDTLLHKVNNTFYLTC